ncbi:Imm43 family immunity protein [Dickeya zeae]|uniref:Imm43 family immunity protein n=1 Tax=Dickeya zeae TaxID=204042 RepID=UPI001FF088C1|nr:Imm43 family immunity protein [Dickeya zeae]
MYYILMNDYSSSLIPRYLNAIVDTRKQVNESWDYESAKNSFPYYMKDSSCPDDLFLLCRNNIGALKFSFYHHGVSQIISNEFLNIIKNIKASRYYSRRLVATSIKDGSVLRDDLSYIYFSGEEKFIDFSNSKLEEDKFGNLIPYDFVFHDSVSDYDVFSVNDTLLAGFLFVSESMANLVSKVKGIKIVPLDKALDDYCIDYKYDLESNRKPIRKKLP